MTEVAERGAFGAKKLVLGFDAGCMTCSELARKIEEEVGDRLEIANLRDPQVMAWRKESLGEDAPWAPTLFEVDGEVVKAWTGKRMGLKLSRALGLGATWRMMQVLGEVGAAPEVAEASPVAKIGLGMSRGQFLKGIGGAAVAMGVLSTTDRFVSPAQATQETVKSLGREEIKGQKLVRVARRMAKHSDLINVAGKETADRWSSQVSILNGETVVGGNGNCRVSSINGQVTVEGNCALVKAVRHKLEGGNSMLAVSYSTSERGTVVYEYNKPVNGIKREAQVWKLDSKDAPKMLLLEESSRDGLLDIQEPEPGEASGFFTQARCRSCRKVRAPGGKGRRRGCSGVRLGCVWDWCAPCAWVIHPVGIYTCFLIWCSIQGARKCCRSIRTYCGRCPAPL
ncbi:MAG: hypothetical protein ACFB50_02475 [Rubrobacteraceae bacterium]